MNKLLQLVVILGLVFTAQCAVQADLVVGLENITQYNKPWYSGYLTVSYYQSQMHYFFFPSQNNPSTDPVLLWLNGGPGCSSLLGATQENGPFVFLTNGTTFQYNNYSWNKNASVLYLESPPGVGFSQSQQNEWDDNSTAEVNLQALVAFFGAYPEYLPNPFYIAGESYAGIYIPYLATVLDQYNTYNPDDKINFKGIAVGNGCTHPLECQFRYEFVDPFQADTFYDQGMYPPSLRQEYLLNCANNESQFNSLKCINTFNKISSFLGNSGQQNTANIYNLIGQCYWQELPSTESVFESDNELKPQFKQQGQARWLHSEIQKNGEPVPGLPPCTDGIGPYLFFNNATIKKALHVNTSINWYMCVNNNQWKYDRSKNGSYHLYPNLIQKGYRIWIYSGDTDAAVPTTGTLFWTNLLADEYALATIEPWRAWYQPANPDDPNQNNRQNAGQYWKIQGLSLVLFKGCGHMVPQDNRIGGQQLINYFFQGKDLPAK